MAKIRKSLFLFLFFASVLSTFAAFFRPLPVYASDQARVLTKDDMTNFEKLTFYNTSEPNIIGTDPEGRNIGTDETYSFMKKHRLVSTESGKVTANYSHVGQFHGRDISADITFSEFVKKPTEIFGEMDGSYICVPLCFRDNFRYDGESLVQNMVFYYSDDASKTAIDMTNAFIVINGLNVNEYAGAEEDHQVYVAVNNQLETKTEGRFICYGNGPQGYSDTSITGEDDKKYESDGKYYEDDISNPLYYICSAMFILNGSDNDIYIEDRGEDGGYGIEWSLDLTTLNVTYNINTSVENGTISDPVSGIIYNTDQKVTYSPSENYILDSVTIDGTPVDPAAFTDGYEFMNITQDHDIHVVYKLPYRKIETDVVNGEITPTDNNILYGTDKKIRYAPNEGFLLDSISVDRIPADLDSNSEQYLFENITEDHQIKVVYLKPEAPVKRVLDKNGEFIDGKSAAVGDILTYEIAYKNNLDKDADITITDAVPAFTEFVSASDGVNLSNGKAVWKIHADPVSEGAVSMDVRVREAAKGNLISNYALETIEGLSLMSNTVKNPVQGDPVISVRDTNGKDINGTFIDKDQVIIYAISVKNTAAEEKNMQITDKVPEGMAFIEADSGGTLKDNTVFWDLAIKAGEEKQVSFKAKAQKAGIAYINQARVILDGVNMLTNKVENWTLQPPVKEVKQNGRSVDGREVKNGETIEYLITVKNTSSKPADIRVEDKIPDHIEVTGIDNGGSSKDGIITWSLKDMPSQETRIVKFTAKAKGGEDPVNVINKAVMTAGDKKADTNEVSIKIPVVSKIEVLGDKLKPGTVQEKTQNRGVTGERKISTGDSSDIMALILIAMCALAGIITMRLKNA